MWAPQNNKLHHRYRSHAAIFDLRVFCLLKLYRKATLSINPKRVWPMPSNISYVLRLLRLDAVISPRGRTCTPPAPPGPPAPPAAALMASTAWASPTAGELQGYAPELLFASAGETSFPTFFEPWHIFLH